MTLIEERYWGWGNPRREQTEFYEGGNDATNNKRANHR